MLFTEPPSGHGADDLLTRPDGLLIRPDKLTSCPDELLNRPDELLNRLDSRQFNNLSGRLTYV